MQATRILDLDLAGDGIHTPLCITPGIMITIAHLVMDLITEATTMAFTAAVMDITMIITEVDMEVAEIFNMAV